MKRHLLVSGLVVSLSWGLSAAPISQSTFTEVVRQVEVVRADGQRTERASVRAVVQTPDLVRTGAESRAELTAPDQTVTRIGANTVFSFEAGTRELNLQQGNVLFYTPPGQGGLKVKTAGASAAVLGTTLIVSATRDGGFKVITLEGKARVVIPGVGTRKVGPGQVVFVLPGGGASPVMTINLGRLVASAGLVKGFATLLPSAALIQQEIANQQQQIADGEIAGSSEGGTTAKSTRSIVDDTAQFVALPIKTYAPSREGGAAGIPPSPIPPAFRTGGGGGP